MTLARDDLSKSDAVLVAAIESNVPDLTAARTLIDDFRPNFARRFTPHSHSQNAGASMGLAGGTRRLHTVASTWRRSAGQRKEPQ
jgi:hypothetical protein